MAGTFEMVLSHRARSSAEVRIRELQRTGTPVLRVECLLGMGESAAGVKRYRTTGHPVAVVEDLDYVKLPSWMGPEDTGYRVIYGGSDDSIHEVAFLETPQDARSSGRLMVALVETATPFTKAIAKVKELVGAGWTVVGLTYLTPHPRAPSFSQALVYDVVGDLPHHPGDCTRTIRMPRWMEQALEGATVAFRDETGEPYEWAFRALPPTPRRT